MKRATVICALSAIATLAISACGSSSSNSPPSATSQTTSTKAVNPNAKEKPPPGDIPDSTQFVRFSVPAAGFSLRVPEGWARTGSGAKLTFTSNLNTVSVEGTSATGSASPAGVKATDVPALSRSMKGFRLVSVTPAQRAGQTAIRVRFTASSPANAVTGKSVPEEAESYVFTHGGKKAVVTLAGAKGADNVDAWRIISNSLRWAK
jgi:hypothetical protein